MEILAGFNPLWLIAVLAICGIVGSLAVGSYRIKVLEKRVNAKSEDLDDCKERLIRIETKVDILLNGVRHDSTANHS